jgi:hypothetical protein
MNMHEIKTPAGNVRRFAASHGDAVQVRKDMAEETGIGKLSITIAPVDVPTDKKGLIAFLNGLPSAKAP